MKKMIALLLALCFVGSMAGCKKAKEPDVVMAATAATMAVVDIADPETALDKIYANVKIMGLEDANAKDLESIFKLDLSKISDFYVRFASGRFGVADVFVIKPKPDQGPALRQELENIKDMRKKEFESYDIYDAHQIAQDAPIFEQGGYLIMLMLDDAEGARTVIDQYIPKT